MPWQERLSIVELLLPLEACPLDVGVKGNRLRTMLKAGLPVPEAYVLNDEHYAMTDSEIVAADVRELMGTAFSGVPVVVRSSSADEEVLTGGGTGGYGSYFDLRTADEVLTAIAYRALHGAAARAPMHVVVQRMVPCEVSGVLSTRNPIAENATMLVEVGDGLTPGIVAGLGANERYTLPRAGVPAAAGADWAVTDDGLRGALKALGHLLEVEFGGPQEVEWGVHDGRLYVFESRDIVTTPVARPLRAARPGTCGARAVDVVISPGYGIGPATAAGEGFPVRGRVVVLDAMPTAGELGRLSDAAALILRAGNALSHSARLTRELGIPAVVANVATPGRELEGMPVLVDAVDGRVTPLLALPPVERKKAIFAGMRQAGMRGTSGCHYQGRYETVLADPVFQQVVRTYLGARGVAVLDQVQEILPFDDADRSYCGISAWVQTTGPACGVQFTRTNLLPDRPFRFDEDVRVGVETAGAGVDLLRSLHYVDRPAQQRRIETADVDDVQLQFSFWPGATQAYLGLASETPQAVERFLAACGVPVAECAPLDGEDLFEVLGLGPKSLVPDHFSSTRVHVSR
jgi:phosphohistidine swiveling domain-containing protein